VLLPQTGGEEMHVPGRMGIDALQDIDQIDRGIDALETTRREQPVDDPDLARAHCRPTKPPVFAAERHGPNLPFQLIRIPGHIGSGQKHLESCFPFQRLPRRLATGMGGEADLRAHGLFEPGKEVVTEGVRVLPSGGELGHAV
jgi:hypothetical protein